MVNMYHLNFPDPENNVRAKITLESVLCPRFGTENSQAQGYSHLIEVAEIVESWALNSQSLHPLCQIYFKNL